MTIDQLYASPVDAAELPVDELIAIASAHAVEGESRRRLTPEVAHAVLAAGFARHFVPSELGGHAGTFGVLASALAAAGQGCLSAAWCALIYATSGRMAAYLPPEGQEEVWADGPDVGIAAGLVPSGEARPIAGGWRLSGHWKPISGVDFAGWALLCAPALASSTADSPVPRFFAVPRHHFTVEDTWDTVGMRATGSNTVVVDDVVVPAHRVFAQGALFAGAAGPGAHACHRVPMLGAAPPLFASVSVGAARAALGHLTELIAARPEPSREPAGLEAIGRAGVEIDSAWLLVERACVAVDGPAPVDNEIAARGARDSAYAAQLVRDAVHRTYLAAGGQAQRCDHALQRIWRDVHSATSHAALRWDRNAGLHTKAILGG